MARVTLDTTPRWPLNWQVEDARRKNHYPAGSTP